MSTDQQTDPRQLFIEDDGQPLETDWHRRQMNLLIELVQLHLAGRDDYWVGGNMFIYYDRHDARRNVGPDFFYVDGRPLRPMRRFWKVWEEDGCYPDVIVELSSPSTIVADREEKWRLYRDVFQTKEYFIYDPDADVLEGWRLHKRDYQPIEPNKQGRLWCEQLQAWLGRWEGDWQGHTELWLRLFDRRGRRVLNQYELVQKEKKCADKQRERAREEKRRADEAEKELARLRSLLQQQQRSDGNSGGK